MNNSPDDLVPQAVVARPAVVASSAEPIAKPAPVPDQQRILTLDVLRGFALLGIILVNVSYFAFPLLDVQGHQWWRESFWTGAALLGVKFLAELKFITLFSLLFGMGLALQNERARQRGARFVGMYCRRLFVLLGIGVLHGTLIWYGDILTMYALVGFIALAMRNLSIRALMISACILFFIPVLGMAGCAAAFPDQQAGLDSWQDMIAPYVESATEIETQPASDAAPSDATNVPVADDDATSPSSESPDIQDDEMLQATVRLCRFLDEEERIYQSGAWSEMVSHRSIYYLIFNGKLGFVFIMWRTLAVFLLGIVLIRTGVLTNPAAHAPLLRRLIVFGLPLGLLLQATGKAFLIKNPNITWTTIVHFEGLYLGSICLSLAYMAILTLLCQQTAWARRLASLAAVGRMALTNYLGQSILLSLVFYGFGLGMFNRLSYVEALLVSLGVFAVQVVISPIYLRYYAYGPAEWIWRWLTYAKVPPLRRDARSVSIRTD